MSDTPSNETPAETPAEAPAETPAETPAPPPAEAPAGDAEDDDPEPTRLDMAAETENIIETYQTCAEWIRFADAKAAVVLTANGAVASLLIPGVKPFLKEASSDLYVAATMVVLGIWGLLAVLSSIRAFLCILPYRNRDGRHPAWDKCQHFHPAAISMRYKIDEADAFSNAFMKIGAEGFQREVLASILLDSHISSAKYGHVQMGVRFLAYSALPALIFVILSQF